MFENLIKSGSTINDKVADLKTLKDAKLIDYAGKSITPCGFYFANTKYGKWLYLVTEDTKIKMPTWAVGVFEKLTPDQIEGIKNGKMKITEIREGTTKNGQSTTLFSTEG